MPPIVIAHRTCPPDAPENSLLGIRKAAELGADGVEIDLRVSLDQRPFLMHDNTMLRTARFPLPLELTPSFLVRWLRLQGTSERVPSLEETLDALPEGMLLAVDVKTPWAVIALVRSIKRRRIESRVLVWCQSALAVRYVARAAPAVEVAYLKDVSDQERNLTFISRAKRIGAKAVSAHWSAIDREFVGAAHALGLRVYSWHGGSELVAPGLSAGLDGLITDFPKQAREALAGLTLPEPDRILD
ncbi:MAG TPA: glycerophosphodiester phosphodiesterase [Dehalococcoidia bacterium]|nr:glycerophosphodiester phosphodiesterase [Dehalococcoidia bacterium]